jgi:hypothetical protein
MCPCPRCKRERSWKAVGELAIAVFFLGLVFWVLTEYAPVQWP